MHLSRLKLVLSFQASDAPEQLYPIFQYTAQSVVNLLHFCCSNLRLAAHVAESLHWSRDIMALAEQVMAGMKAAGASDFNAVHFRIEKDAKDWALIMGGMEVSLGCSCIFTGKLPRLETC